MKFFLPFGKYGIIDNLTCQRMSENIRAFRIDAPLISGKNLYARQVRYGYPTKTDLADSWVTLPASIGIRQDIEFAFSNWIS